MGEVWLADQESPVRRRVALKLIKADTCSPSFVARFEAERQALAMMEHPNIATVFDAGQVNETPYFVMELVQGPAITKFSDDHQLTIRERLELFVSACRAVQHAHRKGIIHRDIKPSNVLVSLQNETPVVKVIDFGLAKTLAQTAPLTDKTLHTEIGQVMGTLQYMSPEQASTTSDQVDTRSDVYSLGVVLYELISGSTPITREAIAELQILEILELIRSGEYEMPDKRVANSNSLAALCDQRSTTPARLVKDLRRELSWIVAKAIEKDPERRFESVSEFADEVENYLNGDIVNARPPSIGYRWSRLFENSITRNPGGWLVSLFILITIQVLFDKLFDGVFENELVWWEQLQVLVRKTVYLGITLGIIFSFISYIFTRNHFQRTALRFVLYATFFSTIFYFILFLLNPDIVDLGAG